MRFTRHVGVLLFLWITPLIVWLFNLGFILTIFIMLLSLLGYWIINLSAAPFLQTRQQRKKIILHSINASHYVEKVRWALHILDIDYEEQTSAGIMGIFLLGRTVPTLELPGVPLKIGNSPNILRYLWGEYSHLNEGAAFLKPTSELLEMEKKIDRLGVSIQRILYFHLLNHKKLCCTLWGETAQDVPRIQRIFLPIVFPLLKLFIKNGLGISETLTKREEEYVETILSEMDELLKDDRQFIDGVALSFIDITFASLAAPLVIPRITNYGGGKADHTMIEMPEELKSKLEALNRKHPISMKFIRKMYEEHR